jgi:hypothetical protein
MKCASLALAVAGMALLVLPAAPSPAAAPAAAPQLLVIYPTAPELPANHLKFYLHFSRPMRQGVFLEHCRLLDDQGQVLPGVFRETELWNQAGDRLTLWFHPGRQKTGVNLNDEFGPVLLPGRHYRLVISGSWPSAEGVPMGKDVEKSFTAVERATEQLDVKTWRVTARAPGARTALQVEFPAPLDHSLLSHCLRLKDSAGQPVAGTASIGKEEKSWQFVPESPWRSGVYQLEADSILEDLAGNSLARPFEVDITADPPRKTGSKVRVEIRIGEKAAKP